MVEPSIYESVGKALELLAQSPYHRTFGTGLYLTVEVLPPIKCNQIRFIHDERGNLIAMVSWACLSTEILEDITCSGRSIWDGEWNSGPHVFVNDWISPYGHTWLVRREVRDILFENVDIIRAFRRYKDRTIRRVVTLRYSHGQHHD